MTTSGANLSSGFKVKKVGPINIYHLHFKCYLRMTLSLLRAQEFYESQHFAGKHFELDEYIEHYTKEKKAFDYITDTGGMNIPGDVFLEWMRMYYFENGEEYPLSDREFAVVEALVDEGVLDWELMNRDKNPSDFYIIATAGNMPNIMGYLAHEIRHAMFYLIPEYRDAILEVVRRFPVKEFRRKLAQYGYNKRVMEDEIHAYALTGYDPFYDCTRISDLPKELQLLRRELKKVEKNYIKKGQIHVPK